MPNGMDYSLLQRVIDGTGMILDTEPGTPDDVGTYVTEDQLADWIKGKILFTGYYHNGNFYSDNGHTTLLAKVNGALYIDQTNANKALYVCLSSTYQSLTEEAQVQAIIDGLNDGTIVPLKAKQDQNGNVIDQTYETKADASDLKSAIQGNSQRIENLEIAVSGSLVQTNVLTDPPSMANVRTITNANEILPWAILKRVGARAVAWNQVLHNDLASLKSLNIGGTWSDNVYTFNGVTFTVDDTNHSIAVGGTSSADTSFLIGTFPSTTGHKFYLHGTPTNGGNTKWYLTWGMTGADYDGSGQISDGNGNNVYVNIRVLSGQSAGGSVFRPQVNDMTLNGFGTDKASFNACFPSTYPYNAGEIIPLNPSAFKVVGKQKWDEVWSAKEVDASTGLQSNTTNTRISNDNLIPVFGGEVIYLLSPADVTIYGFDAEGNYIGYANINTDTIGGGYFKKNQAYTVPARMAGFRFMTYSTYGNVYNHDIMCCLNSVTDKTYEAYTETTIDTSFTSDYKYVNESCYDYSENVLVNGVMRREEHKGIVGSYTFTGNEEWGLQFDYYLVLNISGKKRGLRNFMVEGGYISPNYTGRWDSTFPYGTWGGNATNSQIVYKMVAGEYPSASSFAQHMAGKTIYFEKATPSTPTLHEPIPNFPCEDGTTVQAVTPQTDLVNAIDVPSTIAYMTKISS